MSKRTTEETDRLMMLHRNPTEGARCEMIVVKGESRWWCPRHRGFPRMTLDTSPPFCADCYHEIQREDREA